MAQNLQLTLNKPLNGNSSLNTSATIKTTTNSPMKYASGMNLANQSANPKFLANATANNASNLMGSQKIAEMFGNAQ